MAKRFNPLGGQLSKDHEFLAEILSQICDYAVDNNMNPNDTVMVVANNLNVLAEISNFENWERRSPKQ